MSNSDKEKLEMLASGYAELRDLSDLVTQSALYEMLGATCEDLVEHPSGDSVGWQFPFGYLFHHIDGDDLVVAMTKEEWVDVQKHYAEEA